MFYKFQQALSANVQNSARSLLDVMFDMNWLAPFVGVSFELVLYVCVAIKPLLYNLFFIMLTSYPLQMLPTLTCSRVKKPATFDINSRSLSMVEGHPPIHPVIIFLTVDWTPELPLVSDLLVLGRFEGRKASFVRFPSHSMLGIFSVTHDVTQRRS